MSCDLKQIKIIWKTQWGCGETQMMHTQLLPTSVFIESDTVSINISQRHTDLILNMEKHYSCITKL